jgi:biofilm protein TabA
MIYDLLENSQYYSNINRSIELGLSFLKSSDLMALQPGRIDLEGESIYALVQQYFTKPELSGVWEAHRRYIDIQYMVSGRECIGFSILNTMNLGAYDAQRDFQSMSGSGHILNLFAGSFVIFYPQDAHMPGLIDVAEAQVKKIVIKCAV